MSARIVSMVSLGVRLGLYDAMNGVGPMTPDDLATRAGYQQRWVLEWLRGQASAGIVAYHGDDRFELPTELGTLLADEDHLDYLGHVFESIPQTFAMIERMPEVFRTGIGLSWDDRGEEAAERIEKAFRNWYRQILVPKALPQLDGIVPRLSSGAKVADIGCGAGIALIEMARAFPHSDFHGYDDSEHALARAVANREAAAATKVSFHNVAAEPLPDDGSFDLICTLDVLHDLTRPDEVASVIRRAIAPDGVWFIADVDCGATFEDNLQNPLAPMFYSASIFGCLSSGLSEPGGAGLGTAGLPEPKMRDLVTRAGFTRFRRLDLPSPINAYYEARA